MANVDAAKGLFPVGHLSGAPFNGLVRMYLVPSSGSGSIFVGDPVKSAGTAGAAGVTVNGQDVEGMATIAAAAAGDALRGVVIGFLPDQDNLMKKHRTTSTNRIALVVDDPGTIFEIQEDSEGGALAATAVGANADFSNISAGSATTGISGVELDSSGIETTTTSAQLRVYSLVKKADNILGVNAKWLVVINEHELKGTAGV